MQTITASPFAFSRQLPAPRGGAISVAALNGLTRRAGGDISRRGDPHWGRLLAARPVHMARRAAVALAAAAVASGTGEVDVTFRVHNAFDKAPPLTIQLKDADTGEESEEVDVSAWQMKPWDRTATGDGKGTYLIGKVPLGKVSTPGAALIKYVGPQPSKPEERAKQLARVYVTDIQLAGEGAGDVVISAHSWVNAVHTELYGPRVFFKGEALLPSQTPDGLKDARELELAIVQGVDKVGKKISSNPRQPADRIEDYATYNDLGNYPDTPRPVLGDPSIDGYAYPRRIATNRGLNGDGKTEVAPKGDRWVPADDDFDETKTGSFNAALKYAAIPLVVEQLTTAAKRLTGVGAIGGWWAAIVAAVLAVFSFIRNFGKGAASGVIGGFWDSFKELTAIYDNREDTAAIIEKAKIGRTDDEGLPADLSEDDKDQQTREAVAGLTEEERDIVLRRAGISLRDWEAPEKKVPAAKWKTLRANVNDRLDWPEPLVYSGHHTPATATDGDAPHRHEAWSTDEEFGRQFKAGANPLVLMALSKLPAGSAFGDQAALIEERMEGHKIADLVAEVAAGRPPRIYLVDYEKYLEEFAPKVNAKKENRCLYAGRALFYQRKNKQLVPVAIELHAPGTAAADRTLFTPQDPKQVWLLAKAAFGSIDSGIHQLISHWLRTHACAEPYIIATDRCLSQLHPVYKLLQPHLQYTFRINADARGVLIAADKIVELVFTPGSESMQLSAAVYADWQFKHQGFAGDVLLRGIAKEKAGGGLEIIAEDFPWAEDGLLIWNALHTYISDYLRLYYMSDSEVTGDPELTNWWREIREKGHADARPEGWPALETVDDLADILAIIAWTNSAHHAAVNFGQADYSSFPLNRSSLLRKPIPAKGTPAYEALTDPARFEKEYLRYLANQLPASIVIAVMEILSTHAENEHYLTDANQNYITDPEALKVHERLLDALSKAEATIAKRNGDTSSPARAHALGGLPYQLLIPSGVDSEGQPLGATPQKDQRTANRPGRGIPFSISI